MGISGLKSSSLCPPHIFSSGSHSECLVQAETAQLPRESHKHWCVTWLLAGSSGILGCVPVSWQAPCPDAFQWLTCCLCLSASGFLCHMRKDRRVRFAWTPWDWNDVPRVGILLDIQLNIYHVVGAMQSTVNKACNSLCCRLALQTRLGEVKGLCFPKQDCERSLSCLCCPWTQPLFCETFLGTLLACGNGPCQVRQAWNRSFPSHL